MVNVALQHRVEQFLYREVRLLSELRLEEWLDLFTDDARYWMPARETVDGQPDAVSADGEMAYFDGAYICKSQRAGHSDLSPELDSSPYKYFSTTSSNISASLTAAGGDNAKQISRRSSPRGETPRVITR